MKFIDYCDNILWNDRIKDEISLHVVTFAFDSML